MEARGFGRCSQARREKGRRREGGGSLRSKEFITMFLLLARDCDLARGCAVRDGAALCCHLYTTLCYPSPSIGETKTVMC